MEVYTHDEVYTYDEVMMTNEPPQGCAAPQLPRLLRMIRPDRERLPERETEQCAMCGWTPIRPRRRATSSSRPSGHPEASCCRTATSTWPSMPTLEKICEKTHPTPTLLKPDFSVFLLQNGVMMTNASRPKAWGCAPPQLPRLLRMIRPDRGRVRGLLCNATVGRRRGLLEPDKIATASRLYRLPERV